MVILKKIKSATLVEALVASVLVVVIFVIASLILNNLVLNTYSKNTHIIENRLNELEYECNYDKLILPYEEVYEDWDIQVKQVDNLTIFSATNDKTNKQLVRNRAYAN